MLGPAEPLLATAIGLVDQESARRQRPLDCRKERAVEEPEQRDHLILPLGQRRLAALEIDARRGDARAVARGQRLRTREDVAVVVDRLDIEAVEREEDGFAPRAGGEIEDAAAGHRGE